MIHFNPQSNIPPAVLATDLDGTFIPLDASEEELAAMEEFRRRHEKDQFRLIFATGRHLESVMEAIRIHDLPTPEWIICDVGSSIYRKDRKRNAFEPFMPYKDHLQGKTDNVNREVIEKLLNSVSEIRLQSRERQGTFKISYECDQDKLENNVLVIKTRLKENTFPYSCIGSVDPFEHCGLIDVMPSGVSKAYALIWLAEHADFNPREVVFAGDSGNDLAALTAGFRAILVGNGSRKLAESVRSELGKQADSLFYHAQGTSTSGVLEGCRYYRLID